MTVIVALVALGLQGLVTLFDEFHFHRRRGLPRWERIGHPLDTLTVLACYAVAIAFPFTAFAGRVYLVLAVLSCLFVTKDEFVHAKYCEPFEHWLHALLFVLHPVVLASVSLLWVREARTLVFTLGAFTLIFAFYQTFYWNTPWLRSHRRP
jgi:CDP-diglyceride synthetase